MNNVTKDLLRNPYYAFNDKKATILENYYNINVEQTTLDEAAKIPYKNIGDGSPIRFNAIHNFFVYGLDKIAWNLENGEWGLETEISGDAIILPNTIQPYPGDYFTIKHLSGQKYLFKIISVSSDTFDDGANFWKIEYKLDQLEDSRILDLVINEYEFNVTSVGGKYNPIVIKSKYDLALIMDGLSVNLKNVFKSLFYNEHVQTFTFLYMYLDDLEIRGARDSEWFYDPYLIEFIINNDLLQNDGNKYMHIMHMIKPSSSFIFSYNRSIWRALELKDKENIGAVISSTSGDYINDRMSIFSTRYERFFKTTYEINPDTSVMNRKVIGMFPSSLIDHISSNTLYDKSEEEMILYNIIIRYFNDSDPTIEELDSYDIIQYCNKYEYSYFFMLPMVIFCLEKYVKRLIS